MLFLVAIMCIVILMIVALWWETVRIAVISLACIFLILPDLSSAGDSRQGVSAMLFAAEDPIISNYPTTIIGVLIFVIVTLLGTQIWTTRQLFGDLKETRSLYAETNRQERELCAKAYEGLAVMVATKSEDIKAHISRAVSDYRHDLLNIINKAVLQKELYLAQKAKETGGDTIE